MALVADIDGLDENSDYVVLMTLHSAKGLEFPNVYLAGMEDGLFPSYMSITSDDATSEIEEERRLAYVGITRAKEHLTITSARMRMVRGETQFNKVSRFVKEIPRELMSVRSMSQSAVMMTLKEIHRAPTERLRRPSKRHLYMAQSMRQPLIHSVQGHLSTRL